MYWSFATNFNKITVVRLSEILTQKQLIIIPWLHHQIVTCLLCREFIGHRWIPLTKAMYTEHWCFLWSAPEHKIKQTIEMLVIWDAMALIRAPLLYHLYLSLRSQFPCLVFLCWQHNITWYRQFVVICWKKRHIMYMSLFQVIHWYRLFTINIGVWWYCS